MLYPVVVAAVIVCGFAFWLWSVWCFDRGREQGRRSALSRIAHYMMSSRTVEDVRADLDYDLRELNNEYLRDYRRTGRGEKRPRL